ncbi:hypothetical protein AAW51_2761 [Caldimonas brevitalea]|uniref:Uncharacterized protein n=1 Tax=Caldimonas brevitalea TaxID=413882 RepID=A0A0G3BJ99_9BURK|nr:hypothetical protein AAW51_2761 [Caldimonas brevitalea]
MKRQRAATRGSRLRENASRHEQERQEAPPIGLILYAGKKQEQIELLELGASGIHVAEYLTVPSTSSVGQRQPVEGGNAAMSLGELT